MTTNLWWVKLLTEVLTFFLWQQRNSSLGLHLNFRQLELGEIKLSLRGSSSCIIKQQVLPDWLFYHTQSFIFFGMKSLWTAAELCKIFFFQRSQLTWGYWPLCREHGHYLQRHQGVNVISKLVCFPGYHYLTMIPPLV